MSTRLDLIRANQRQRTLRTRSKLKGTATRPRLSVHISHRHYRVQVIDDQAGKTLVSVSTLKSKKKSNASQQAQAMGKSIAQKCTQANIKKVVFDRGRRAYHGRLKALAEAARQGGLEF